LSPQHLAVPSVSTAHEWSVPTITLVAVVMPETSTGVVRSVVVPSPSWPLSFSPQHFTLPSVSKAQEWVIPVSILVAVVMPDTVTVAV
jgi:hypothetical protein